MLWPYIAPEYYEAADSIYAAWKPESVKVAATRIARLYRLIADMEGQSLVERNGAPFNMSQLTATTAAHIIRNLPVPCIESHKQLSEEFTRLLRIYGREDITKDVEYALAVEVIHMCANSARATATLASKVSSGCRWDNILDIAKSTIATIGAPKNNPQAVRAMICVWVTYLPPLRIQDYVSAAYGDSSTPGNVVDLVAGVYTVREFKTVRAFDRLYADGGARVIALPDELLEYMRIVAGHVAPGTPVFSNGRIGSDGLTSAYTHGALANVVKLIFGECMRSLRIIYASDVVSALEPHAKARVAYTMGHSMVTQLRDYAKPGVP